MKSKKKEIMYLGLLLFCSFIIYHTFQAAFTDVILTKPKREMNICLLSFHQYVYLIVSLLLTGFTTYLYRNLKSYHVGKIFAGYLTIVSMEICLIAATNCRYERINIWIGILAFLSNVILFYLIGALTQVLQRSYFKWIMGIYIFCVLCIGIFYLISAVSKNFTLSQKNDAIMMWDYIITIFMILLSLLCGYRKSTTYSKKQIKFLTIGLLVGIVTFVIGRILPSVALVNMMENDADSIVDYQIGNIGKYQYVYSYIQIENRSQQEIYPIMIFSGIIIALIYLLIKREYLIFERIEELWCYFISIIYLILANTYFYFAISNDGMDFVLINMVLNIPLLLYYHWVCKREESPYDKNRREDLEEERQRLAIYLHDDILQNLIALLHSDKKKIEEELSSVIGEIRNISHELYPTIVEDLGVEEALQMFVNDINNDYNVEVKYEYEYPKGVLPKSLSMVLYRTVRELVTNAVKHSGCVKIEVMISEYSEGIQCIVADDGKGFQKIENKKLGKDQHMGLYTVRKQIENLGGNIRLISDKTGSQFTVCIPLE